MGMAIKEAQAVSSEAIRSYIKTIRRGKQTQSSLASALDMAYSTYRDWEQGVTQATDIRMIVRLFDVLNAPLEDLRELSKDEATIETGRQLALERIKSREEVAEHWLAEQTVKMQTISDDTRKQAAFVYRRMAELLDAGNSPSDALRLVESELKHTTEGDS